MTVEPRSLHKKRKKKRKQENKNKEFQNACNASVPPAQFHAKPTTPTQSSMDMCIYVQQLCIPSLLASSLLFHKMHECRSSTRVYQICCPCYLNPLDSTRHELTRSISITALPLFFPPPFFLLPYFHLFSPSPLLLLFSLSPSPNTPPYTQIHPHPSKPRPGR